MPPAGRSGRCSAAAAWPRRSPRPVRGRTPWAGAPRAGARGARERTWPRRARRAPAVLAAPLPVPARPGSAGPGWRRRPAGCRGRPGRTGARPRRPDRPRPAAVPVHRIGRSTGRARDRRRRGVRNRHRCAAISGGRHCRIRTRRRRIGRRSTGSTGGGRRGGRDRPADDLPEPQLRGLPERTGLLALLAGHGDRQVGPVEDHLGAAHPEAVDPLLDDLLGLEELLPRGLRAGLGAGHQRDPGAALQIDAQLRRGPTVTGEEDHRVQHDDDTDERAQIAPGTDPPRGGCQR